MMMTTATPHQLKMIFKGRLEFGTPRAYELMSKQWLTRSESYFKSDILFKQEQIFQDADLSIELPQQTLYSNEKSWRTTIIMLSELAQYAVVGSIKAWCIDNGRLVAAINVEPTSEKVAVSEYLRGREIVQQNGCFAEASIALNHAIGKYARHAAAYERRGYINYKLQNYADALTDFSKSIGINPNAAEPHYGSGKVRMLRNEWEQAAADFAETVRCSIALEPIYWLARLKRGESLFHAKRYDEAAKELRLYLGRSFAETDPNFYRRRRAFLQLGKALGALNDIAGSEEAIQQALALKQGSELAPDYEALLTLGIVKRGAGKPYTNELEAAARLGSHEAAKLLAEMN